jgi:hypothetical protein
MYILPNAPFPLAFCAVADKSQVMQTSDLRIALFSGNYNYVRDGANQALNRLVGYLLRQGASVRIYSPTVAEPAFVATGDLVSVPSVANTLSSGISPALILVGKSQARSGGICPQCRPYRKSGPRCASGGQMGATTQLGRAVFRAHTLRNLFSIL